MSERAVNLSSVGISLTELLPPFITYVCSDIEHNGGKYQQSSFSNILVTAVSLGPCGGK